MRTEETQFQSAIVVQPVAFAVGDPRIDCDHIARGVALAVQVVVSDRVASLGITGALPHINDIAGVIGVIVCRIQDVPCVVLGDV